MFAPFKLEKIQDTEQHPRHNRYRHPKYKEQTP